MAQGCVDGIQDAAGDSLVFAPKVSGSLGVDARFPINDLMGFAISYDAVYSDDYRVGGRPEAVQEDFWRHNARAGLYSGDGTWEVMLIGRNLSDEKWIAGCADKPGGGAGDIFCQAIRARQVMLQGTYRFR